jgi:hypothetical protein
MSGLKIIVFVSVAPSNSREIIQNYATTAYFLISFNLSFVSHPAIRRNVT